jgi:hypothetical protein
VWGEVTPAERLRAVTRRGIAEDRLAAEAADALAGFAREPASLVVACRRLLAHHRSNGALWWVCARILAAADAGAAARESAQLLDGDCTGDRLAATLPLLDENELVAVIGWPVAADEAFAERLDLPVVAVRTEGADPVRALRSRRRDTAVRVVDPWDALGAAVRIVLAPAVAIGPDRALVPLGTAAALDELVQPATEVWLVGGVGRVLPGRLFDALLRAASTGAAGLDDLDAHDDDELPNELVELERFDRVAGTRGLDRPLDAAARVDCPVVPELLRPLG